MKLEPIDYESMQDARKNADVRLIYGKRGNGKSLLTKTELLNRHTKVIVIDPVSEYTNYFSKHFYSIKEMYKYISQNDVYRVSCSDITKAETIAEMVYEIGDIHLVLEETQAFLPESRDELPKVWKNIILRGRHKNIEFTSIAQRPSIVNINLRAQHTVLDTFFQNEPDDLDWIKKVSGITNLQMLTLKRGEYFECRSGDYEKKRLTRNNL